MTLVGGIQDIVHEQKGTGFGSVEKFLEHNSIVHRGIWGHGANERVVGLHNVLLRFAEENARKQVGPFQFYLIQLTLGF